MLFIRANLDTRKWAVLFNELMVEHIFHTHFLIAEMLGTQTSPNDLSNRLASELANRSSLDSTRYGYKIWALKSFCRLLQILQIPFAQFSDANICKTVSTQYNCVETVLQTCSWRAEAFFNHSIIYNLLIKVWPGTVFTSQLNSHIYISYFLEGSTNVIDVKSDFY